MPKPDMATVKDFVQYLHDCSLFEDTPEAYDAISEGVYWELKRRVEKLQEFYPALHQLPNVGQDRWRELQEGVATITPTNQTPFFQALDRFLAWMATYYGLVPSEQSTSPKPPREALRGFGGKRKTKKRTDKALMLRAALARHHFPNGDECVAEPITEEVLAEMLGISQSTVSRLMKEVFQNGGSKFYRTACRTRRIEGFRKKLEDGSETVEGVDDPEDE